VISYEIVINTVSAQLLAAVRPGISPTVSMWSFATMHMFLKD